MILSSFMRKNAKRKVKVPNPPRPHQSPTSPALSVSPEEIFDINEKTIESRMIQDSNLETDTSVDRPSLSTSSSRLNAGSPLVHLDYIPEPLENWFPQEFLSGTRGTHNSGLSSGVSSVPEPTIAKATHRPDAIKEESNGAATSHVGLR